MEPNPRPGPIPRAAACLAALLLAWQAGAAAVGGARTIASVPVRDRREGLASDDAERTRVNLQAQGPAWEAAARRTPETASIYVLFRKGHDPLAQYFKLVSALYPRTLAPVMEPPPPESAAVLAAPRPDGVGLGVFALDLDSGFGGILEAWFEPVESGPGFVLWGIRDPK